MTAEKGVYLLSDPGDVKALISHLEKEAALLTQAAKTSNQQQVAGQTGLEDLTSRIQLIEEKLRQLENYVATVMKEIEKEFAALRQEQVKRQLDQREEILEYVRHSDKSLRNYVEQTEFKMRSEETGWQKKTEQSIQQIMELVKALSARDKDRNNQGSWLRQLFGLK